MKVHLKQVNSAFHFSGTGQEDIPVHIDASPSIGGENAGARPMELFLMSLASCGAIDIILILKKQRQKIDSFEITVDGQRIENEVPSPFKKINIHFSITGELQESKVQRAIELSFDKYCSVSAMLKPDVKISTSFSIN